MCREASGGDDAEEEEEEEEEDVKNNAKNTQVYIMNSIQTLDFHDFPSFHFPRQSRDFLLFPLSFCLRRSSCFSFCHPNFLFQRNMNTVRYTVAVPIGLPRAQLRILFLLFLSPVVGLFFNILSSLSISSSLYL